MINSDLKKKKKLFKTIIQGFILSSNPMQLIGEVLKQFVLQQLQCVFDQNEEGSMPKDMKDLELTSSLFPRQTFLPLLSEP